MASARAAFHRLVHGWRTAPESVQLQWRFGPLSCIMSVPRSSRDYKKQTYGMKPSCNPGLRHNKCPSHASPSHGHEKFVVVGGNARIAELDASQSQNDFEYRPVASSQLRGGMYAVSFNSGA